MSEYNSDEEVAVVGVTPAASAAVASMPNNTIDLCSDDEAAAVVGCDRPLKRARRHIIPLLSSSNVSSTSTDRVVWSVDEHGNCTNPDDDEAKEMRYRQALGPVRMEFVTLDQWPSPHAFLGPKQQQTQQVTTKPMEPATRRMLYKELVEYQLNLPVHWSSSIFCRVLEARSDLLRVLITGALVSLAFAMMCCDVVFCARHLIFHTVSQQHNVHVGRPRRHPLRQWLLFL